MVREIEGRNGRMNQRNGETQKDHTRISSSLLPSVVVVCSFSSNESGPGAFFFFALSFALNFGLPECFLSLTVAFSPSNLFFEKKDTTHTHSDDDVSQNVSQCLSPAWPTGGLARTLGWWRRVRARGTRRRSRR